MRHLIQKIRLNQYEFNLTNTENTESSFNDFIFRKLTLEDFKNNTVFYKKDRINRYTKHIINEHTCYGFEASNGDIAAYFWLTTGEKNHPIPNPAFKYYDWLIGQNEAYIWDCRTVEEYQRKGLYRAGLRILAHQCREKEIQKIMISCHPSNVASIHGIESAGFIKKGTVISITTRWMKMIYCLPMKIKLKKLSSNIHTRDVFP